MKNKTFVILLLLIFPNISFSQDDSIKLEKLLNDKAEFEKLITIENDSIKIEAIEFLMKKKGDTRLNITWYGYTNPEIQEEYNAKIATKEPDFLYATNQLVALYLITAIYYSDPKYCSKVEISFIDKKGQKRTTTNLKGKFTSNNLKTTNNQFMNMKYKVTDEKIIVQLFAYYEKWFSDIQRKGLHKVTAPIPFIAIQWTK